MIRDTKRKRKKQRTDEKYNKYKIKTRLDIIILYIFYNIFYIFLFYFIYILSIFPQDEVFHSATIKVQLLHFYTKKEEEIIDTRLQIRIKLNKNWIEGENTETERKLTMSQCSRTSTPR